MAASRDCYGTLRPRGEQPAFLFGCFNGLLALDRRWRGPVLRFLRLVSSFFYAAMSGNGGNYWFTFRGLWDYGNRSCSLLDLLQWYFARRDGNPDFFGFSFITSWS